MKNLKEVLELHKKWLNGKEGGIRAKLKGVNLRHVDLSETNLKYANLSNANLSNANLRGADLRGADLRGADLRHADLKHVDLRRADLRETNLRETNLKSSNLSDADLRHADLYKANLSYTNLKYTNLSNTDLSNTDLRHADLSHANLSYVNLSNVDLRYTDLNNIKYNYLSIGLNLVCPEEGIYIGYKKAKTKDKKEVIIKLLITEDALRSSATSRKCRCSKAKVISITSLDGIKSFNEAYSNWDKTFIYKTGGIVEVDDFNTNRWEECGAGIHHFITRKEAVEYQQI